MAIARLYIGDDDDEDNGEVIEETSMFINPFALGIIIIVVLGVIGGIIAFIFILNRKPSQRPIAWVPSYPIPPPPPPQPIHPVKFCQICGKRLLGNEKFCQNCGKPTN